MKHSDILKKAKELIADPKHWTKGVLCRDENFAPASVSDGVCFCTLGAVERALYDLGYKDYSDRLRPFVNVSGHLDKFIDSNIPAWNDNIHRSHGEVLALFDCAIKDAEKEEAKNEAV